MATLRELKKHLSSVQTTGTLAGAMKTVSTAKYSRINSVYGTYRLYAEAYRELADRIPTSPGEKAPDPSLPAVYVLFSGNRGLCGGYHSELFSYFGDLIADVLTPYELMTCGRAAADYCRERGLSPVKSWKLSDIPTFSEAKELSGALQALLREGKASAVYFVYQKFTDVLHWAPHSRLYLPLFQSGAQKEDAKDSEIILLPDAATVREELISRYLDADMYAHLLQCASGVQSATMTAMRTAKENADESAEHLEMELNRRRQFDVTADIIETASGNNR